MTTRSCSVEQIVAYPPLLHEVASIGYVEKMVIGLLILINQPKVVIETGVFKGQTTRFVSEFLILNRIDGCVYGFDFAEVIDSVVAGDEFFRTATNVEFVRGELPTSLARWLQGQGERIGLAVIDAAHDYTSVTGELTLLHPHLADGAYVFCHDYREKDPGYEGTMWAVNSFASKYRYEMLPLNASTHLGHEVVWGAAILRKPLRPRGWGGKWKYLVRQKARHIRRRLRI